MDQLVVVIGIPLLFFLLFIFFCGCLFWGFYALLELGREKPSKEEMGGVLDGGFVDQRKRLGEGQDQ